MPLTTPGRSSPGTISFLGFGVPMATSTAS